MCGKNKNHFHSIWPQNKKMKLVLVTAAIKNENCFLGLPELKMRFAHKLKMNIVLRESQSFQHFMILMFICYI
jgi:hypothetical protein